MLKKQPTIIQDSGDIKRGNTQVIKYYYCLTCAHCSNEVEAKFTSTVERADGVGALLGCWTGRSQTLIVLWKEILKYDYNGLHLQRAFRCSTTGSKRFPV